MMTRKMNIINIEICYNFILKNKQSTAVNA
jgi:hypothetical protein